MDFIFCCGTEHREHRVGGKRKRKIRELSGNKELEMKGWESKKRFGMEVGRIGNWNPEKANFPTLDACAFAITPGTLLHRPLRVDITLDVV